MMRNAIFLFCKCKIQSLKYPVKIPICVFYWMLFLMWNFAVEALFLFSNVVIFCIYYGRCCCCCIYLPNLFWPLCPSLIFILVSVLFLFLLVIGSLTYDPVCLSVGRSVGWSVGRLVSLLVGWSVCHSFLKGVGSYTSMLLSENIRCVTIVLNSVSESSLFAFKPNTTAFETLFIVISKRNAGKVSLPCANRSTYFFYTFFPV